MTLEGWYALHDFYAVHWPRWNALPVAEQEVILVRFPTGVEWAYSACTPEVWEAFTAPGQSKGSYISQVLNAKPNSRWTG